MRFRGGSVRDIESGRERGSSGRDHGGRFFGSVDYILLVSIFGGIGEMVRSPGPHSDRPTRRLAYAVISLTGVYSQVVQFDRVDEEGVVLPNFVFVIL